MIARAGDIVWAFAAGKRGGGKCRPHVVLGSDDADLICVAVSTSVLNPLDWCNVALPFHPAGSSTTKLKKQCWAVCNWLVVIREEQVDEVTGHETSAILDEVRQKVRQCGPSKLEA